MTAPKGPWPLPRARDFRYIGKWTSPCGRFTISGCGGKGGGMGKYRVGVEAEGRSYICDTYAEVAEEIREALTRAREGGVA